MLLKDSQSHLLCQAPDGLTVTREHGTVSFSVTKINNDLGVQVTADFKWVEQRKEAVNRAHRVHFRL